MFVRPKWPNWMVATAFKAEVFSPQNEEPHLPFGKLTWRTGKSPSING